jgi:hypothetical protein
MTVGGDQDMPRRRRTRRWIGAGVAVVVVAIVAVLVAQGGGSGGGPLNAIAKAAEVTRREPGGRALIHATVRVASSGEGITETGSMTFDDSGRARGNLTVEGHRSGQEAHVEVIASGTKAYASSDQFDSLPEGKKWLEVDLSAAVKGSGSPVPAENGPTEGLKILERVEGAEKVGEEEVDGVPTTHYRGTFPTPEEVFGVKVDYSALDVEVWIDGQGRVRRLQAVVSGVLDEEETTTEMTIDYVEFGGVPKIEPPSPEEVFDVTGEIESNVQSAAEGH